MSSSQKATLAIFGATGGSGLAVLKNALAAGHEVNVLARTASKLSSLSSTYPNLHIIQGDIHSIPSVKETLLLNHKVVDIVISGIGMVIHRQGLKFTSADTTICEVGTRNILTALDELDAVTPPNANAARGPLLVLLSTTGISSKSRDIPIAMIPLYHWMLAVPHKDKKKMEAVAMESQRPWVVVRPSLLADGPAKGLSAVRTGVEVPGKKEGEHAIGYTIRREDVGAWIFEECIKGGARNWVGKCVSLTY